MANISAAALLDALQQAMRRTPSGDGHTLTELCAAMAVPKTKVREAVRALLYTGKAQSVRLYRPAMDNSLRNVPGYRLVGPPKVRK